MKAHRKKVTLNLGYEVDRSASFY